MKKKSIKTAKNPFVTTAYIGPEYFCDRKKETDDLVRLLTNGNNVALISPRRIGKTDLLRHCFAQPVIAKNDYNCIQRVMNEMFSNTPVGSKCTCEYIDEAIHNIIADSSPIYEDLLYQLPPKQSQVLMAIAREGKAENLTSGQFASKYGIVSPSSVKSAVPALIDKGLLTLDKGVCQVYDKFFQLWMLQQR